MAEVPKKDKRQDDAEDNTEFNTSDTDPISDDVEFEEMVLIDNNHNCQSSTEEKINNNDQGSNAQEKFSIKDHILFHKALISENEDNMKLDKYMDLVEQLEHGMSIVFPDPFDRAIAITFELAIKHQFNPWDIDLERFSNEYLRHVKKNNDLDLVTAGRIILMAWKILKLQSDKVLQDAQAVKQIEEEELWHEPDGDWFTNDNDFEFTTIVISNPEPPIQEMIWHKGNRRVSLMELIGALEEAKRESELFKLLSERREVERERLKIYRKLNINTKLHQENLQEDIEMVYSRITKFNGHPIPLSDIYTSEPEDKITTLVSSLFLAHNRRINIWQRKFPFGQIFVRNLNNFDISCGMLPTEGGYLESGQQQHKEIDEDNNDEQDSVNDRKVQKTSRNDEENALKGKVLIRNLDLVKIDNKKKKKLKKEMEEVITSQKNIAS